MQPQTSFALRHFASFEESEWLDLAYGAQLEACEKRANGQPVDTREPRDGAWGWRDLDD